MAEKRCPKCPECIGEWLQTYGDMVTLILTFFVVILSSGKSNAEDSALILSAFRGSLGIFDGGSTLAKGRLEEMGMSLESLPSTTQGRSLSKFMQKAQDLLKPLISEEKVRVSEDERGVIITLLDVENFHPGSATLRAPIKKAVDLLAPLLKEIPNYVRVEGHSDGEPLAPAGGGDDGERRYVNNWDLAGARAINVVNYINFRHKVAGKKLSAVSFGANRPLTTSQAGTPEARGVNRRVDIIILTQREAGRQPGEPQNRLPENPMPGMEFQPE